MIPALHTILHGLAIKKYCNATALTDLTGLQEQQISEVLEQGLAGGRVSKNGDSYMLSPAGQLILLSEYSRFYDELRSDADFIEDYERFEVINDQLKQLITNWQTMAVGGETIPNDHSSADYDDKIIDRLDGLHEKFEPVLARMAAKVSRLKIYSVKLLEALKKAEDGAIEWVSDAKIESYHTVWFEMHEDLLRILGRERSE